MWFVYYLLIDFKMYGLKIFPRVSVRFATTVISRNVGSIINLNIFIYLFTITFQRGKWWSIVVSSVKRKYNDES
jgi:hypothetical protein